MANPAAGLVASFYGTRRRAQGPDERLETALQQLWEQGRVAWLGVPLEATALAAYVGERAVEGATPADWVAGLSARDLFLACACAEGNDNALRVFEATFLNRLDVYLRKLRPTPELVAETKQVVFEKLFVGSAGQRPRIEQYRGQGALEGWVRIVAVRTALDLLATDRAGRPSADEATEIARAIVPAGDPELALLRASCESEFLTAFRASIADLSQRDRGLLRFVFVEQMTPAQVAAMYGCHRTTAMRWIETARDEILQRTRSRLMDRLQVSASECDRMFALVRSRIDITLNGLLATPT